MTVCYQALCQTPKIPPHLLGPRDGVPWLIVSWRHQTNAVHLSNPPEWCCEISKSIRDTSRFWDGRIYRKLKHLWEMKIVKYHRKCHCVFLNCFYLFRKHQAELKGFAKKTYPNQKKHTISEAPEISNHFFYIYTSSACRDGEAIQMQVNSSLPEVKAYW